jgi:hypothetical protein
MQVEHLARTLEICVEESRLALKRKHPTHCHPSLRRAAVSFLCELICGAGDLLFPTGRKCGAGADFDGERRESEVDQCRAWVTSAPIFMLQRKADPLDRRNNAWVRETLEAVEGMTKE